MTALFTARGIAVTHGRSRVLHDVDFCIASGEIVTIGGPNGSGKSILLKALIGAIPLSAGTLSRAPGLRIGYVPQKLTLDPTLPLACGVSWIYPIACRIRRRLKRWKLQAAALLRTGNSRTCPEANCNASCYRAPSCRARIF